MITTETIRQEIEQAEKADYTCFKNEREAMAFCLSVLDLTTLEGSDTRQRVHDLCVKAQSYAAYGLPNVAAVCVYPVFAAQVKSELQGTDIRTACVAGAFPAGQSPLEVKLSEIAYAVSQGADEIDMVISRGKFLEERYEEVSMEIQKIREVCQGGVHLKVILETGELADPELIYKASIMAMEAGADFIKTSTGKVNPAATPEAFVAMLHAIKDFHAATGKQVGIKPAGGISTAEGATLYIKLLEKILGTEWLFKKYFRIGASRLADAVFNKLT